MSNASIIPPNRNSTDWLKYFPFERRSWKRMVAEAGLPDEAQKLIHRVVKKSRLMRFEKIEVIQELIGHFQDGLRAGNDYPYLIANFGDPDVTAKLVRRSKKRNRPVMLKALQIFGWMILGIFSAYFMVFAYFHSASPSPTTDYLAELNSLQGEVDESDKAWPIYRPLWIKYGFSEGGGFGEMIGPAIHHAEGDDRFGRLVKPGDPEWPAAVAKLEEISDLLEAFREGATKPRLGLELQADVTKYSPEDFEAIFPGRDVEEMKGGSFVKSYRGDTELEGIMKDAVINVLLPHLQQLRTAARMFVVDTRWAVEQNDSQRAVRNFETFIGLGSQAADSNLLIGSLIGFAIEGIGFNELEETLLEHPDFFTDQQLARLQKKIEGISFEEQTRFEGERAFQLDLVQRAYSDNGNGDGRITPLGVKVFQRGLMAQSNQLIQLTGDEELDRIAVIAEKAFAPAALFVTASRRETEEVINRFADEYISSLEQPYWDRDMPDVEGFLEGNKLKHAFLGMIVPAFDQVINATDRMTGRKEGVLTGLAMQRYYLQHGQWPERLVDLSPDFMLELPVDILNGEDLLLAFDDRGPIVYSVGNDGDDDGGVQVTEANGRKRSAANWIGRYSSTGDGDWIVWPQSRFEKTYLDADSGATNNENE